MGCLYLHGKGVEQDGAKGIKLYLEVEKTGSMMLQRRIGDIYYYGEGVERDTAEGLKWYLKAAEAGCEDAMLKLGRYITLEIELIKIMTLH